MNIKIGLTYQILDPDWLEGVWVEIFGVQLAFNDFRKAGYFPTVNFTLVIKDSFEESQRGLGAGKSMLNEMEFVDMGVSAIIGDDYSEEHCWVLIS